MKRDFLVPVAIALSALLPATASAGGSPPAKSGPTVDEAGAMASSDRPLLALPLVESPGASTMAHYSHSSHSSHSSHYSHGSHYSHASHASHFSGGGPPSPPPPVVVPVEPSPSTPPPRPAVRRFTAHLTAAQAVPRPFDVPRNATGRWNGTLRGNELTWTLRFKNATSTVLAVDFNIGRPGRRGRLIKRLCRSCATFTKGTVTLRYRSEIDMLMQQRTYINLHTEYNRTGEIRGRVVRRG